MQKSKFQEKSVLNNGLNDAIEKNSSLPSKLKKPSGFQKLIYSKKIKK